MSGLRANLCLLLHALLALTTASAQTGPVIHWQGGVTCPRPAALERDLEARSQHDLSELAPLELLVEITPLPSGSVALSLIAQGGEDQHARQVELASCAEAERAAVMLIATALAPAEPSAEPPADEHAYGPWSLRTSALLDLRAVPGVSGGPALGVALQLPLRFQVWADARYLFARDSELLGGARARVDLFALGLGGGLLWSRARWSGGPVLELELGALRGRANQGAAGSRAAPWLSAWGGARGGYRMGRFDLQLVAQLGVPFLRPEFSVGGGSARYLTGAVTGRVVLGLSIALGTKKAREPGQ